MTVRAKFTCLAKSDSGVSFQPVTSGPGNESWSKWTPSGRLDMHITNPDALAQFEAGKSYFLDFTPAD